MKDEDELVSIIEDCVGCGVRFDYEKASPRCVDLTADLMAVGHSIYEFDEEVPEVPGGLYWCTAECFARWAVKHAAEGVR